MSELEEILKDRSRIENERDDTTIKHQKLQKKCERLQDELNKHKDIVTQLKAKIMDYGEQQVCTVSFLHSDFFKFMFSAMPKWEFYIKELC